jgi:hypothetical protein
MVTLAQATEQAIREWFREMQACVRAVDYDRAQRIFAADAVHTHFSLFPPR